MLVVAVLLLFPLLFLLLKKTIFPGSGKLPPGPNTWQILRKASQFRKQPHAAFSELAKIYGPLMSLRFGSRVVIVASSAATAKEILQTQDKNFSGRFMPWACYKIPAVEEASIAMAKECNDAWKFVRGLGQNFIFSAKALESKACVRKAKVVEMVKYLQSKQGISVQLDDFLVTTNNNIVSEVLVSRNIFDLRREDENDGRLRAAVGEVNDVVSSFLGLSDLFPFLRKIDFSSKRKAMEIYRRQSYVWENVVKERRLRGKKNDDGDFLDVLLDNGLCDDQIYVTLMEILINAADASTTASIWFMTELIKNPDILKRVADEVAKAFDDDDMMMINESVLTESRYLQACIKESLRLHSPGALSVPHRAIEACTIGSYVIPKDSIVLVNVGAVGLDPNTWKDADVFNPDRFLDSKVDFRGSHFEFIPFSSGRRMCPGYNVALKNMQIIVASLVHYFDWKLPGGMDRDTIDMSEKFDGLLKMEKPLHLIPMSTRSI